MPHLIKLRNDTIYRQNRMISYHFGAHFSIIRIYNKNMNDYRELELLINYYAKRLRDLPQGYLGYEGGNPIVCVLYDPMVQSCERSKRHRYRLNTPKGRYWAAMIKEYLTVKTKLDELIRQWNLLYRGKPRQIDFPLVKRSENMFTSSLFDKAKENANPIPIEHPIEYKGHILRSKNELLGCQILERLGYEYKVEIAVGNDPYNMLYPDLTFKVPEQERCIGVEINGALDKAKYSERYFSRQKQYIGYGLMISKDIIFVDMANPNSFYAELFETQVRVAVLAGLDDIVFPKEILALTPPA